MLRPCLAPARGAALAPAPGTVSRAVIEGNAMTATQERVLRAGDKLAGRVAFVTGGTRGIGAAISRSLATQGASVATGSTRGGRPAEELMAELPSPHPEAQFSSHTGDVGKPDDCRRTIAEVIDRHGRLDILVNNAGITADGPLLKMSDEDWQRVVDVNLSGAFYTSRAALEHMLERGTGRIVNVSSV